MSGRAGGRLGYGDQDTNTPVTPNELNDVYTHGQFWIPAGALTAGVGQEPEINSWQPPSTGYPTYTVARYDGAADEEAFFTWCFKADFVKVPTASMLLKVNFIWTCLVAGGVGNDTVQWASGANNTLIGTDLDFNNAANEVTYDQEVPTVKVLQAGKTANAQAGLAVPVFGDVVSGSNINMITILAERHAASAVADNYTSDALLLGLMVQFAVDFNNVAVWPT